MVNVNMIKKVEGKVTGAFVAAQEKMHAWGMRAKDVLENREGQGTLDVAITVLISIVLGALILGGLYLIVKSTVLPTITQRIKDMFDYTA